MQIRQPSNVGAHSQNPADLTGFRKESPSTRGAHFGFVGPPYVLFYQCKFLEGACDARVGGGPIPSSNYIAPVGEGNSFPVLLFSRKRWNPRTRGRMPRAQCV